MCSSICNSYCFLLFSIFCSKGSGKEMQLGCKVKISGMSGKDFASRHFPYRQYRRCSSRRFPVADRGNSRVKRYLSLFLHPISEVLDLWQHPEKWKNTELFLYISVSFSRFGDCSASCDTLSRGGIYQSCHAFRCLGDDCPDTGQPAGCSGFRLSGRVFW